MKKNCTIALLFLSINYLYCSNNNTNSPINSPKLYPQVSWDKYGPDKYIVCLFNEVIENKEAFYIKTLLDKGFQINRTNHRGNTPLHEALINMFVPQKTTCNSCWCYNAFDGCGDKDGHAQDIVIVKNLVRANADIMAYNKNRITCLDLAQSFQRQKDVDPVTKRKNCAIEEYLTQQNALNQLAATLQNIYQNDDTLGWRKKLLKKSMQNPNELRESMLESYKKRIEKNLNNDSQTTINNEFEKEWLSYNLEYFLKLSVTWDIEENIQPLVDYLINLDDEIFLSLAKKFQNQQQFVAHMNLILKAIPQKNQQHILALKAKSTHQILKSEQQKNNPYPVRICWTKEIDGMEKE